MAWQWTTADKKFVEKLAEALTPDFHRMVNVAIIYGCEAAKCSLHVKLPSGSWLRLGWNGFEYTVAAEEGP